MYFKKIYCWFLCMGVPLWVICITCMKMSLRPEKDMRFPGTWLTGGCGLPERGAGNQPEFALHCWAGSLTFIVFVMAALRTLHIILFCCFWLSDASQVGKKIQISWAVAIELVPSFQYCVSNQTSTFPFVSGSLLSHGCPSWKQATVYEEAAADGHGRSPRHAPLQLLWLLPRLTELWCWLWK